MGTGTTTRSPSCHPPATLLSSPLASMQHDDLAFSSGNAEMPFSLSLVSTQRTLSSLGVPPTFQGLSGYLPPVAFPHAPPPTLAWADEALTLPRVQMVLSADG